MKIENIIIINDFNYAQGGASKIAIDTAKLLKETGINMYFFSAVNKYEENIEGIKYITTNQNEALKEKNKIIGAINGIYNFKARKELKRLLETLDNKKTIIHIHGWTKALSSSVFDIAFKMNFKVVLTLHDYFTACPNGGYYNYNSNKLCELMPLSWNCIKCNCDSRNYLFKLYRIIRQFVQNRIVKLNYKLQYAIVVSNFSEQILKRTLGKQAEIIKIYNPIDIKIKESISNVKENEYFLYVGRISKEKGVDIFCEAITDLNLKGVVVGDGDEKERLQNQYSNIEFTGWKKNDEVQAYMRNAKVLVFPSKCYETMGLTIVEAQTLGIPCIVSQKCAGSEFVEDGKNGFTFNGLEDLKVKIKKINELNIEKNNNNLIKMFNKEQYLSNILDLYASIKI